MTESKLVLGTLLSWSLVYLWLPKDAVMIFAVLMAVDFVTGVISAYVDDKTKVRSQTAIKWAVKKVSIFLVPFVVALMLKGAWYDAGWMVTTILSILIVSEWYSILGNIYSIKTGNKVTEIDALWYILELVRKFLDSKMSTNGVWQNHPDKKQKQVS